VQWRAEQWRAVESSSDARSLQQRWSVHVTQPAIVANKHTHTTLGHSVKNKLQKQNAGGAASAGAASAGASHAAAMRWIRSTSMERKHVRTVLVVEVVHASAVATTIRCVINGCHARIPEHHETTS
jgi:hypothetical protein